MTTRSVRNLGLAALPFWLVAAGYGARELIVTDVGDDWELPYAVFATALPIAAALTLAFVAAATGTAGRSVWRSIGLGVGALGAFVGAVAAWAVPIWSALLAVGLGLLAARSDGPLRRPLGVLAAGPAVGFVTQFAAPALGAGEDVAAGLAIVVAAAIVPAGLGSALRSLVTPDRAGVAASHPR